MMRPRSLAALSAFVLLLGACSKIAGNSADSEPAAQSAPPTPMATATASASVAADPKAPPPPPVLSPTAAPLPPSAPFVDVPPEPHAQNAPAPTPTATATGKAYAVPKTISPAPRPASEPAKPKGAADLESKLDDGLQSSPAPSLGVKKVVVAANNHFTCSSTERRDNVAAIAEPRGARISIVGQGPCPGEVHDWSAQISERRVEVHGTHGTASKCKCAGTGELVLRGLDPGTYDINVNGGFDRPIATRIVVSQ